MYTYLFLANLDDFFKGEIYFTFLSNCVQTNASVYERHVLFASFFKTLLFFAGKGNSHHNGAFKPWEHKTRTTGDSHIRIDRWRECIFTTRGGGAARARKALCVLLLSFI